MPTSSAIALRQASESYRAIVESIQTINPASQVRPEDPIEVITASRNEVGDIRLTFAPIVCLVPERAKKNAPSLYVVIEGSWTLRETASAEWTTTRFATRFGYFEVKDSEVRHCYGGHYDFDCALIGHPIAHLQLSSQRDFIGHVQSRFKLGAIEEAAFKDFPSWLLSRVRTPCAQMDVLSTLLQVCADHLINERSEQSAQDAFNRLIAKCHPFRGFNHDVDGCSCERAVHWYERRPPPSI